MKYDRSRIDPEEGAILVLDNGAVIVSGSETDDYTAGSEVTVYDSEGVEIGHWDSAEWEEDPVLVMGAILCCAARGYIIRPGKE